MTSPEGSWLGLVSRPWILLRDGAVEGVLLCHHGAGSRCPGNERRQLLEFTEEPEGIQYFQSHGDWPTFDDASG
jgi:hypothetical protein